MGVDSRLAVEFSAGRWVRMFCGSVLGSHLKDGRRSLSVDNWV
jgi:hypothetical protein